MVSKALALADGASVRHAARLAEIDVAGELADDQDVQPRDDFGLERRGLHQSGKDPRRTQVGEQAQLLAQAAAAPAPGAARAAACRTASRRRRRTASASASPGQRQGAARQRVAAGVIGGAAHVGLFGLDLQAGRSSARSTLTRLGDDFGADPVTGQYRNLHVYSSTDHAVSRIAMASPGCGAGAAPRRRGSCRRGAASGRCRRSR